MPGTAPARLAGGDAGIMIPDEAGGRTPPPA